MNDWNKLFERKFRPAFREMELLKVKIERIDGLLMFKWHTYTMEELLSSEHHHKIHSITEKIGDDAQCWYKRNELSEEGNAIYENKKYEVEEELHKLNVAIQGRKPTWWERARRLLENFIEMVKENLPILIRSRLESMISNLSALPLVGKLVDRLLPPPRPIEKMYLLEDSKRYFNRG